MNTESTQRLGWRLSLLLSALVATCCAVSALALGALNWVNQKALDADTASAQRILLATRWQAEIRSTNDAALFSILNTNPVAQGILDQRLNGSSRGIAELTQALQQATDDAQEKQSLEHIETSMQALGTAIASFQQLKADGKLAFAVLGVGRDLKPKVDAEHQALTAHIQLIELTRANQVQHLADLKQRILYFSLAGGIIVVSMGLAIGLRISAAIGRDIHDGLQTARAIAHYDLTVPATAQRKDELGELLRELESMRLSLGGELRSIQSSTREVETATNRIAQGNTALLQSSHASMEAVQHMVEKVSAIKDGMQEVAGAAGHAHALSQQTRDVANKGGALVTNVVDTMEKISGSSRRINDIIGAIEGIAFQTNILALNAAVEAARAGEQGRGFAVVASEVRSLAQRSATAALEIKDLINHSVAQVAQGSELVQSAGATMQDIVKGVHEVTSTIAHISQSTSLQSQNVMQVDDSLRHLERMAQANGQLAHDGQAATQRLYVETNNLVGVVDKFNTH